MRTSVIPVVAGLAILGAGCGSSKHSAASTAPATTTSSTVTRQQTTSGPGALQAEAKSAATGDIPDNQAFVKLADRQGGFTMKYPEGWAQSGGGRQVVIRDKNNIIRVVIQSGSLPSVSAVSAEIHGLPGAQIVAQPQRVTLPSGPAVKVVYSTKSAPNAVTGKRVTLVVDRYYLARAGKEATVDLGTPQGVDNVDAYRLMIDSFRWR
jgi:hypothetical protein